MGRDRGLTTMDFDALRREAIRQLEKMSGGLWSDFNTHDPGITILEQLCYALTDLGYRIAHDVPDLLAEGGADPYASLYPPAEILPTRPVTLVDLRRLLLDVEGVRNAWIEPLWHDPVAEQEIPLYYLPKSAEIRHGEAPAAAEPVKLKGLYRVLIENADPANVEAGALRAAVARRLHANRNLCEDFAQIRVLEPEWVRVDARLEIAAVDDSEQLLQDVFARITDYVTPPIPFDDPEQMLADNAIDDVFDGPLLREGYLHPEALLKAQRRTLLNTSDLIHMLMEVPGVRAVRSLALSSGATIQEWSLRLDPTRAPALDLHGSVIRLEKERIPAGVDVDRVVAAQTALHPAARDGAVRALGARGTPAPPTGRDRKVASYSSIQHQFPAFYGIGELGLPESAPPERKARARQLRAYLMFFDQLLANTFAQLAHAKDLFSFHDDSLRTYFTPRLEDPALISEDLFVRGFAAHSKRLRELTETPNGPGPALQRKNRFLNHLLARFAEPFGEYALVLFDAMPAGHATSPREAASIAQLLAEKLARDKQAFLKRYPRISGARGTAGNVLKPFEPRLDSAADPSGETNLSGLEERVWLKLGFMPEIGEDLVVIEHILLRPDEHDLRQRVPLLAAPASGDPYSLQLSFVLPRQSERFLNRGFRRFAEQTIREETPAHLTPYVHWLEPGAWTELRRVHREWLKRRRERLSLEFGLTPDFPAPESTTATQPFLRRSWRIAADLRAARDRLIDILGLGETFPLQDVAVETQLMRPDGATRILICPGPTDVSYALRDPIGRPVQVVGDASGYLPEKSEEKATGIEPVEYKVLARKVGTGREAYLHQTAPMRRNAQSPENRQGLGQWRLGIDLAVAGTAHEARQSRHLVRPRLAADLFVITDPLGAEHGPGLGLLRLGIDLVVTSDPWRGAGVGQLRLGIDLTIAGPPPDSGIGQQRVGIDLAVAEDGFGLRPSAATRASPV